MYGLRIEDEPDKLFSKLSKKNPAELERISKKIDQILDNPYHFKPLRNELQGERRVHIGHFVLVFDIIEENKIVRILRYEHHDYAYE